MRGELRERQHVVVAGEADPRNGIGLVDGPADHGGFQGVRRVRRVQRLPVRRAEGDFVIHLGDLRVTGDEVGRAIARERPAEIGIGTRGDLGVRETRGPGLLRRGEESRDPLRRGLRRSALRSPEGGAGAGADGDQ